MNLRMLIAAPLAVLLTVLSLASLCSNVERARPALAAPLVLRPGLPIRTLPARQVHPSAADRRAAAMLTSPPLASLTPHPQALADSYRLSMPYYAFAPHLLTAKD